MAGQNGGARPGAGRPKKVDEERVRDLAIGAIVELYGSEQAGFRHLLRTGEPVLIKFVFEHAMGKPREKIDMDTIVTGPLRIGYGNKGGETEDNDPDYDI